jgi:hypothetical protein
LQQEISLRVNGKAIGTLKAESDGLGVASGRDNKIEFELTLTAVMDHINAGIDLFVAHLAVIREIRAPPAGIVAQEVVAPARQFGFAANLGRAVRAEETNAEHRGRSVLRPYKWSGHGQRQHRFGRGQEQGVAAAAREKLHLALRLA